MIDAGRKGEHEHEPATQPNGLEVYSMILLAHGTADAERYLLLRRAATKRLAPGLWTGLGGRVESDELADLAGSALRELAEETGIASQQVADLHLRRVLSLARPGAPLEILLYFTGRLSEPLLPTCPEGTLAWVGWEDLAGLDIIANTREVIPLLIEDLRRDPPGRAPVQLGAARYRPDGRLERMVWA